MTGFESKRAAAQVKTDPLDGAKELKRKEEAGHKMNQTIKEMWRRALKHKD